jgi:hypothetical protein
MSEGNPENSQQGGLRFVERANPVCPLTPEQSELLGARQQRHSDELLARSSVLSKSDREELRQLRQDIGKHLGVTPDLEKRIEVFRAKRAERYRHPDGAGWRTYNLVPVDYAPLARDGVFWWIDTKSWYSEYGSLGTRFLTDGMHLFGSAPYDDGDLLKLQLGVLSRYYLSPDRLPSGTAAQFRSGPLVEVYGSVFSSASRGIFGFPGDAWVKCWINVRQLVYQWIEIPAVGMVPITLGEATVSYQVINNENPVFTQSYFTDMPGWLAGPTLTLGLYSRALPLQAELEVKIDIQLEGESEIRLSPEPNPNQSVLVRMQQWRIEAV